ncbi:hypothetical protein BML2526_01550 [Providencia rettgeri]|nr:hypothetical protein BML2526_01550 [Providencia rettgeri]BBV13472.1 hypothetical protein BML2576_29310 [Providencia rettgeri]BDH19576.1 hypothetical protein PrNR1418_28670 [Providencia rettgeri]
MVLLQNVRSFGQKLHRRQQALAVLRSITMWYFAWILGTLLACSFAVIAALALEHSEDSKTAKDGE